MAGRGVTLALGGVVGKDPSMIATHPQPEPLPLKEGWGRGTPGTEGGIPLGVPLMFLDGTVQ